MEKIKFNHSRTIQKEVGWAIRKSTRTKLKVIGRGNLYKIKLRSIGYRLAYEVQDEKIIVLVLAVGKRDKGDTYKKND